MRTKLPRQVGRCLVGSSPFVLMVDLVADQLRSRLRPGRCRRVYVAV
jgi:hypothetical protein